MRISTIFIVYLIAILNILTGYSRLSYLMRSTAYDIMDTTVFNSHWWIIHIFISQILAMVFKIFLIIAGAYMLLFKNWARRIIVCTSLVQVVSSAIATILMVVIFKEGIPWKVGFWGLLFGISGQLSFFGLRIPLNLLLISNKVSWIVHIIIPLLFAYYLTRSETKKQFDK